MGDLGLDKTISGKVLEPSAPANPCGLVAKSFFNDSYEFYKGSISTGNNITIDDSNIAWESDVEYKFKNSENY